MQTIVELSFYQKRAETLLDKEERQAIIDYLASHPDAGDIMQGTGGIRKLRWKRGWSGKSGGVRVVYFYRNLKTPLFLLTIYAKGEQENLTKAERNSWKKMIELMASHYGE